MSTRPTSTPLSDASVLGQLVEDSTDAVVIVDEGGQMVYANASVRPMLGYRPDELIGRGVDILVPDHLRQGHEQKVRAFQAAPASRPMGHGRHLSARRADGSEMPAEIALVPLRGHPGHVAALIRDSSVRQRLLDQLAASHELVTAMLGGMPRDETLRLGARSAGRLLVARTCAIALVDSGSRHLEVRAVAGDHEQALLGQRLAVEQSMVWTNDRPRVVATADLADAELSLPVFATLPLGPLLVVRIGTEVAMLGSITFARSRGATPFDQTDQDVAVQFAEALSLALAMAEVRDQQEDLQRMAEHDRIARELHDTVIQRIFGVAMRLESALHLATGPAAERMDEAVTVLDEVIRDIRTTIFGLQHPQEEGRGVRSLLMAEVDEAAGLLGTTPRLGFVGPIETVVPMPLANTLVQVLREALSNVVRHAEASAVEVVVEVADELCLTVLDDGRGLSAEPTAGLGLGNLEARARDLGGTFSLTGRDTGGTRLQWRVPLPAGGGAS